MSEFYTIEDFAKLFDKNPRTIYNTLISKKASFNRLKTELPPFKRVANKFVVFQRDFEEWVNVQPAVNVPAKRKAGRPRKVVAMGGK